MFEAKLTIECPALEALAAVIGRMTAPVHNITVAPTMQAAPTMQEVPSPGAALQPQFQPAVMPQPARPVTPVPPVPANRAPVAVPTAASPIPSAQPQTAAPVAPPPVPVAPTPSFTYDQVGKAGADLIGACPNKLPELLALLGQFGAPAVTELKPEQLGPFATALRGMGAKI